jgi:hypothetical protein
MSKHTNALRPARWIAAAAAFALAAPAVRAQTQTRDTTRVPVRIPRTLVDTGRSSDTSSGPRHELVPPLSPGRAFASSFLLPGYSQTVLGRPKAAALFIALEAMCVTMLRQAQFDLRQARNAGADSVVVSWWNPATGHTGKTLQASPYSSSLVRSRRAHVEDWIAVLIANHLFAGLDAYVAANLWDVPAELGITPMPGGGTGVTLKIRVP